MFPGLDWRGYWLSGLGKRIGSSVEGSSCNTAIIVTIATDQHYTNFLLSSSPDNNPMMEEPLAVLEMRKLGLREIIYLINGGIWSRTQN